jgi:hypothetical protein
MMTLKAGNVGIGTTSPTAKFTINSDAAGPVGGIVTNAVYPMRLINSPTAGSGSYNVFDLRMARGGVSNRNPSFSFSTDNTDGDFYNICQIGSIADLASGNNIAGNLIFSTKLSGSTITERMRITSGGSVCVATTTASYTAENRGNLTIGGVSSSIFAFQTNNIDRSYLYHNGTDFSLVNNSSGGGVYISSNGGGVVLSSAATSWASSSDERLKNINYIIENAVSKLSSLRTVNFSWKSDQTKKEYLGLIAQDVEKVFPQVISKNNLHSNIDDVQIDSTEYLSVRYTELIPVLVKAIQELSAQVDILKQEIINLKNK